MSSFHKGKVKYCTTSGSGDIEENASPVFFLLRLYLYSMGECQDSIIDFTYIWWLMKYSKKIANGVGLKGYWDIFLIVSE